MPWTFPSLHCKRYQGRGGIITNIGKQGGIEHGYLLYITVKKSQGKDGTCLGYVLPFTAKHFRAVQGLNISWLFSHFTAKNVRAGEEYMMAISFTLLQKMSGKGWILAWLFPSFHCIICQGRGGICPGH